MNSYSTHLTKRLACLPVCICGMLLFFFGTLPAQTGALRQHPIFVLHPGDEISIQFRITPELNQTVTVQPDGYVSLSGLNGGPIKVDGLTVSQTIAAIAERASSNLHDPEVSVTLKEFQKPSFVISGEVNTPGRYDIRGDVTALQAVLIAGGMKNTARSSQVLLFRRINGTDAQVKMLDLHAIKSRKSLEHDEVLEPGDMLLIPRSRLAGFERIVKIANLGVFFNPVGTF